MTKYVSVTIDDETYIRLKEIAKRKGITVSDAVRQAVMTYTLLTIPHGNLKLTRIYSE